MASNLVNNLFPPIVEAFQPTYVYNEDIKIYFSISPFNSADEIQYVQVSLTDQKSNENVLLGTSDTHWFYNNYGVVTGLYTSAFPAKSEKQAGTVTYNENTDTYCITIPEQFLNTENKAPRPEDSEDTSVEANPYAAVKYLTPNRYYKIQLRFGLKLDSSIKRDDGNPDQYYFLDLVSAQITSPGIDKAKKATFIGYYQNFNTRFRAYLSEWSTVSLIKPIYDINVRFPQLDQSDKSTTLMQLNKGMMRIAANVVIRPSFLFDWDILGLDVQKKIVEALDNEYYIKKIKDQTGEVSQALQNFYDHMANLDWDNDSSEHLERYRISVYDLDQQKNLPDYNNLIVQTKLIYAEAGPRGEYGINTLLDLSKVSEGNQYALVADLWTNGGYYKRVIRPFEIAQYFTNNGEIYRFPPKWHNRPEARYNSRDENGTITRNAYLDVNQEDGVVKINLSWNYVNSWPGDIYIRRASSKDGFKNWDLIYVKRYTMSEGCNVSLEDFTVCSLESYKYSAQVQLLANDENRHLSLGMWTPIFYSEEVYIKFYDMLLQRQNRQIAIRYNGQVNSWKPVVNRQKVDTLGGKYPKFVENAKMNYKEFTISGLISAESDHNRKFLNEFDGEWVWEQDSLGQGKWVYKQYYEDALENYNNAFGSKYIIRNDTAADGEQGYIAKSAVDPDGNVQTGEGNHYWDNGSSKFPGALVDDSTIKSPHGYNYSVFADDYTDINHQYYQHDLYPTDNWYWERLFREELVDWLNDGEPKLYRSMPEGNVAVILTDVNLTPNPQLGRRLYNFSATLYEVGDGYSLESLDALGIYDLPALTSAYMNSSSQGGTDDMDEDEIDKMYTTTYKTVGQIWLPKLYNGEDLINGNVPFGKKIAEQIRWDRMPLSKRFEQLYSGRDLKAILDPGQEFTLDWARFTFVSKPRYYSYVRNDQGACEWVLANQTEDRNTEVAIKGYSEVKPIDDVSLMLGYKLNLTTVSESGIEPISIFVNDRGFYQTVGDVQTRSVVLENDKEDLLIIDYITTFKMRSNTSLIPQKIQKVNEIVGQWGDVFPAGTSVGSKIFQKYKYTKYATPSTSYNFMPNAETGIVTLEDGRTVQIEPDGNVYVIDEEGQKSSLAENEQAHWENGRFCGIDVFWPNGQYIWRIKGRSETAPKKYTQEMEYWSGISVDITPYALIAIMRQSETVPQEYLVGRTGVLSFWDDYPSRDIIFLGRKMFRVNESRARFLDEWEYILFNELELDETIANQTPLDKNYWKNYFKQNNETVIEDPMIDEVCFVFGITVKELENMVMHDDVPDNIIHYVYSMWLNMSPSSIKDIVEPVINGVYPLNIDGVTHYYIYYIDHHWYPIDETRSDLEETIIAQVPVYGYINYRGNIMRSTWS